MKKLLLYLLLAAAIGGCKQHKLVDNNKDGIIPNQYIVFMSDAFEQPVIKSRINDTDREKQKEKNKAARDTKEKNVVKYLKSKGIDGTKLKTLFADIRVGAVVNMSDAEAEIVIADKANVDTVIQDVTIQINPIQQTDPSIKINPIQQWESPVVPAAQINPIQQSDALQLRYDIDPANHETKALLMAGGFTNGTGRTTVLWFLDTGIDPANPYLNVNAALGASFIVSEPTTQDFYGHGTFCAGVAAGKPIGIAPQIHIGVAEGATVVPVKVLDKTGTGSWGSVIAGLNYVAKVSHAGDVVNLSLGAYDAGNQECYFPGLTRAINNVTSNGVFVTLSAGNDAGNAQCNRPGCINGTNIFTASSINADKTCAPYANFGPSVDYVTVGSRVFSLWIGNYFIMASGTSISSAVLAGIIYARAAPPASGGTVSCITSTVTIAVR